MIPRKPFPITVFSFVKPIRKRKQTRPYCPTRRPGRDPGIQARGEWHGAGADEQTGLQPFSRCFKKILVFVHHPVRPFKHRGNGVIVSEAGRSAGDHHAAAAMLLTLTAASECAFT